MLITVHYIISLCVLIVADLMNFHRKYNEAIKTSPSEVCKVILEALL